MRYLSGEDILVLHARILDATRGAHGVRDAHLLASILEKPKMRFGGKELYQGVFRKAATYLEALATYHVFIDGNKRTALAAAARFLFINGYTITATNSQVERFVLGVALRKHDVAAITKWLKQHSARRAML